MLLQHLLNRYTGHVHVAICLIMITLVQRGYSAQSLPAVDLQLSLTVRREC